MGPDITRTRVIVETVRGGRNGAGLSKALYAEIPPVTHIKPGLENHGKSYASACGGRISGYFTDVRSPPRRWPLHANADRIEDEISGYSGNKKEGKKT